MRLSKLSWPDTTLLVAELALLLDRRRGLLYPPGRSGPGNEPSEWAVGMWIGGACSIPVALGAHWDLAICCILALGRCVLRTNSCSSGGCTARGPLKRDGGGPRAGGAAVGLKRGDGPAGEGFRERAVGGLSSASSSGLIVYHRRTAEAENVCRCLILLKKAGGGLCKPHIRVFGSVTKYVFLFLRSLKSRGTSQEKGEPRSRSDGTVVWAKPGI